MSGDSYSVLLLKEGKHVRYPDGNVHRTCNTILVRGPAGSFIINPGSVWGSDSLIDALKSAGIKEPKNEIKGIICTDGRAEHVGCLSCFSCADLMIVGYDIQKRGDIFLEHDFCDQIAPYEFDENFYVIGTPGQRGPQVSLMIQGRLLNSPDDEILKLPICRIAITGDLFTDVNDASQVCLFNIQEGSRGDSAVDKESTITNWRRSREYVLDRADWIIPAYGPPFKANVLNQYLAVQFARGLKKPEYNFCSWYLYHTHFKKQNRSLEAAAVELSELKPGDEVLEVGFGPGYGIKLAAERVAPLTVQHLRSPSSFILWQKLCRRSIDESEFESDGRVFGVEISEYMLKVTSRRVRPFILTGRVNLELSSIDHAPFLKSSFDACFHVDCFYFWPSLSCSLQKIWKILRPEGRLVTTFHPSQLKILNERGWFRYGRPDPLAYAMALESSGFDRIEWLKNQTWSNSEESYDCIIAKKPSVHLLHSS